MFKDCINKLLDIEQGTSTKDIVGIKFKFIKSKFCIEVELYDGGWHSEYMDFTEDEFGYDQFYRKVISEIKEHIVSVLEAKFNTSIDNIINIQIGGNSLDVICYYCYGSNNIRDVIFKSNKYINWN